MLKYVFLVVVLAQFFFFPLETNSKEITFHADGGGDDNSSCVLYQGSHSLGPGRIALSFYNACSQAVYVYICLTDSFGDSQLLKSASRVPAFGRIALYPFIDRAPASLHWTASRTQPAIPPPCNEHSVAK